MTTTTFTPGQRVALNSKAVLRHLHSGDLTFQRGNIGTIEFIDPRSAFPIGVRFDDFILGHFASDELEAAA